MVVFFVVFLDGFCVVARLGEWGEGAWDWPGYRAPGGGGGAISSQANRLKQFTQFNR